MKHVGPQNNILVLIKLFRLRLAIHKLEDVDGLGCVAVSLSVYTTETLKMLDRPRDRLYLHPTGKDAFKYSPKV